MSFRSVNNTHLNQSGFTLIEVLIVMAIMVFISFGIYQALTETFKLRDTLANEGDFYNTIRLSMGILQRDIEMMYNPIAMIDYNNPNFQQAATTPAGANASRAQRLATQNNNPQQLYQGVIGDLANEFAQLTDYWDVAIDASGMRPMRFVGTDKKMTFVTVSHDRIYKDSPESEFAKVSYEFLPDTETLDGDFKIDNSFMLIKTENTDAFSVDETHDKKFIHTYKILRGITKYKLEYYNKIKDQKTTNWDSASPDFQSIYPDMIIITLEVKGVSSLSFDGIYKFRPEEPLSAINPSQ
jgi:prepilin-type N-terminal cleavage/methylation domain-containing protein